MAPQVLHRVLYGSISPHTSQLEALTIQPAILSNYKRHRVRYCDYPAIIADAEQSSSVRGTYVQGITAADQWRLDVFEGDQYERVKVQPKLLKVNGQEGAVVDAETYVWIAPKEQLEKGEWDFEEFRKAKMSKWVGTSEEYEGELRPSIAGASGSFHYERYCGQDFCADGELSRS